MDGPTPQTSHFVMPPLESEQSSKAMLSKTGFLAHRIYWASSRGRCSLPDRFAYTPHLARPVRSPSTGRWRGRTTRCRRGSHSRSCRRRAALRSIRCLAVTWDIGPRQRGAHNSLVGGHLLSLGGHSSIQLDQDGSAHEARSAQKAFTNPKLPIDRSPSRNDRSWDEWPKKDYTGGLSKADPLDSKGKTTLTMVPPSGRLEATISLSSP